MYFARVQTHNSKSARWSARIELVVHTGVISCNWILEVLLLSQPREMLLECMSVTHQCQSLSLMQNTVVPHHIYKLHQFEIGLKAIFPISNSLNIDNTIRFMILLRNHTLEYADSTALCADSIHLIIFKILSAPTYFFFSFLFQFFNSLIFP